MCFSFRVSLQVFMFVCVCVCIPILFLCFLDAVDLCVCEWECVVCTLNK